jgi:hypothetical protein
MFGTAGFETAIDPLLTPEIGSQKNNAKQKAVNNGFILGRSFWN